MNLIIFYSVKLLCSLVWILTEQKASKYLKKNMPSVKLNLSGNDLFIGNSEDDESICASLPIYFRFGKSRVRSPKANGRKLESVCPHI